MKKILIILFVALSVLKANAQSLPKDSVRGPMRSFYEGCLAINNYLTTKNAESLDNALMLLNPHKTRLGRFEADSIDVAALVERGNHVYYDYIYAKYLFEKDDDSFLDKGYIRASFSECYVETFTVKAHSTVKFALTINGGETFRILALSEPAGSVKIAMQRKSDGVGVEGKTYENGTVSFRSWFIPKRETVIISITNTSHKEESIAFASN